MEAAQAVQILAKVKANWYRQPVDQVIAAEWAECLSRVDFQDALEAVRQFRDAGSSEPPTPGQVWREAQELGDRRRRQEAVRRVQIEGPPPTKEQISRGRAILRDAIEKLGKKMRMAHE